MIYAIHNLLADLGCLMLQEDAVKFIIEFFSDYLLTYLLSRQSAIFCLPQPPRRKTTLLPSGAMFWNQHSRWCSMKTEEQTKSFYRLKATRIHPSTNTFANSRKKNWRKSKKIEFVFHLVLLGHWLTKIFKKKPTKQQIIEIRDVCYPRPPRTFLDCKVFRGCLLSACHGVVSRKNFINWYQNKLWWSLPQYSFCLYIWLMPHCGCALPLSSVDLMEKNLLKSSADDSKYPLWNQKIAQKILIPDKKKTQKNSRNRWLTDWGPRVFYGGGLGSWQKIDTVGSPFPRGESPPRRTPYPPPGPRGYHKDAPRGSPFVVICEYSPYQRCCIRQAPRFFWPQTTPRRAVLKIRNVRPEKTLLLQLLHLIISITLRLVPPMEIRDTSSTRY